MPGSLGSITENAFPPSEKNMHRLFLSIAAVLFFGCAAPCRAQSSLTMLAAPPTDVERDAKSAGREFPSVGIGVRISSLGVGAEGAVAIVHRVNLRGGFNLLSYSRGFSKDGVSYDGHLNLRSAEAHVDWFPSRGRFHLSPGLLVYNGNNVTANVTVPSGQTFTLGGASYMSDATKPIAGKGKLDFVKVAPTILAGWGNLVPRKHSHLSISTEFGVIFQQAPHTALTLAGNACASDGSICVNAATDPTVQANVASEVAKINKSVSPFRYYPVLSLGIGYKF
jgi:hypothetical protein